MIPPERRTIEYFSGVASNPGERYKTVYRATVLKNGDIKLEENGKEDLWQKINAEKDHCDMSYILKQMALGDYSAFTGNPQYFDMTILPQNRMEFLNLYMSIESDFEKLPIEIKQKFNNDFKQWYMEADSEGWAKKMNINLDNVKESEVKENASDE